MSNHEIDWTNLKVEYDIHPKFSLVPSLGPTIGDDLIYLSRTDVNLRIARMTVENLAKTMLSEMEKLSRQLEIALLDFKIKAHEAAMTAWKRDLGAARSEFAKTLPQYPEGEGYPQITRYLKSNSVSLSNFEMEWVALNPAPKASAFHNYSEHNDTLASET